MCMDIQRRENNEFQVAHLPFDAAGQQESSGLSVQGFSGAEGSFVFMAEGPGEGDPSNESIGMAVVDDESSGFSSLENGEIGSDPPGRE